MILRYSRQLKMQRVTFAAILACCPITQKYTGNGNNNVFKHRMSLLISNLRQYNLQFAKPRKRAPVSTIYFKGQILSS